MTRKRPEAAELDRLIEEILVARARSVLTSCWALVGRGGCSLAQRSRALEHPTNHWTKAATMVIALAWAISGRMWAAKGSSGAPLLRACWRLLSRR